MPFEYAARTIGPPPVARMTRVSGCSIRASVAASVTRVRHWKRPSGAPAATAASDTTRTASAVQFAARGCGLITTAHRAFAARIDL